MKRQAPKVRGIFERERGSDVWWVRYRDTAGRLHREKVGTRGMALALLDKRRMERRQGKKLPETLRQRPVLFREIAADCLEYSKAHKASHAEDILRTRQLLPILGDLPIAGITPQQIERALNQLGDARQWKPATWNRSKALLSLAFRLAIQNGKAVINPVRSVRHKREDNAKLRWLTPEEETRLRAVIEANYPDQLPAFMLSLHTGMRRSEQYRRIGWDGVDFEQRRLWVPGSKNGSARSIPLNDAAIAALLALRDRSDGTGPVMRAGKGGHGLLAGEPQKTPKEWFKASCRKAGLADYTWHANRHTFASRLIMAGVPLRTVQELMGHKTIAMTCRYAHLAPQHQLDAVLKLDGWGKAEAGIQSSTRSSTGDFEASRASAINPVQVAVQ
jgi:integrase